MPQRIHEDQLGAIADHIFDAVYQDARDNDADCPEDFRTCIADQAIDFYMSDTPMRFHVECNKEDRITQKKL